MMQERTLLLSLPAIGLLFVASLPASAGLITTNTGFLATYTGTDDADLNIVSAQAIYTGSSFTFTSTLAGPVTSGFYVWGVNQGGNDAVFGSFAPGVLFDTAVIFASGGPDLLVNFTSGMASGMTSFSSSDVTVSGDTITAVLPASDFPSLGFVPSSYQVNLWTRDGITGGVNQIAMFAPGDFDTGVSTPEPATLPLAALSLTALAFSAKRLHAFSGARVI